MSFYLPPIVNFLASPSRSSLTCDSGSIITRQNKVLVGPKQKYRSDCESLQITLLVAVHDDGIRTGLRQTYLFSKYCQYLDLTLPRGFLYVPVPLERFLLQFPSGVMPEFFEILLLWEVRLRSLDEIGSSSKEDFGFS
jgi:hypothetical protein